MFRINCQFLGLLISVSHYVLPGVASLSHLSVSRIFRIIKTLSVYKLVSILHDYPINKDCHLCAASHYKGQDKIIFVRGPVTYKKVQDMG